MVAEIARAPATARPADLRHRRHRDLARRRRVHRARRRHGPGLHRRHGLRLQDRRGHGRRPSELDGRARATPASTRFRRPRGAAASPTGSTSTSTTSSRPQIDQDLVHPVRPLPHRLRGHLRTRRSPRIDGRQAALRGDRRRVRRLQPVRRGLPGRELHHPGAPDDEVDRRTGRLVDGSYLNWTQHPNNPMAAPKPLQPAEPAK